jgi:cysteine desulfurase
VHAMFVSNSSVRRRSSTDQRGTPMTYEARGLIYLDHNARTPIADEVRAAMEPYLRAQSGNPSSEHALGRASRRAVEEAREAVASSIGAEPDEIIFTSGGTESNNRGIAATAPAPRRRIVTSTVEHHATTAPLVLLEAAG